jgi:5-methyltetrahydrofolate--homocysteine methyltransferase
MAKNCEFIFLDGAMGTMLQKAGLKLGQRPETLSLTHGELIESIHRAYLEAGSDVIYTNTFGANRHKLEGTGCTVEQVIPAAVAIGRRAVEGTTAKVALDIGPIGELLEPTGTLSFEEAYDIFKEQVVAGAKAGADLIVFETMTDLYEVKAAVLAAKENTDLPVYVTMTFEANGRTFTGCSPEAMAITLEGLGVDAMGINCSLGPKEIFPMAERIAKCTTKPLIIKANAGLPNLETGAYDIDPEMFAQQMAAYPAIGVTILGGCCGTTPEYISALKEKLKDMTPEKRQIVPMSRVCTPTRVVEIDGVRIIGERINPTGKKRFQQALKEQDMDYILTQGITQAEGGAHLLDVNVGLPAIDEVAMMKKVVKSLQGVLDLPLQIDSSNPEAIEAGLRVYNGKAIVNSVNGEEAVLSRVLPIVKKYGAAVVGLTLDEKGIPATAEERVAIARRILQAAQSYGIPKEDVYIDCLTLTVSAQQEGAQETLKALSMVRQELGLQTVLGVSNISFGLPNRGLINHSFLLLAMAHGLTLPIMNPNVSEMVDAVYAHNVLYCKDKDSAEYIERFANAQPAPQVAATEAPSMDMDHAIAKGLKEEARRMAKELLKDHTELEIINGILIPALDKVGQRFEKGEIFLPQLINAAGASCEAFDVMKESIAKKGSGTVSKGKIIVATVKGDIHDIGKNIVKVILENYGYQVIDLGRDVEIETVVQRAIEEDVHLIGLSALMTTTLESMEKTIRALRESGHPCKIWVGGAVLTPDYAMEMGADYYAKDAKQSVDIAKEVLG